jgi:hypothetical protein
MEDEDPKPATPSSDHSPEKPAEPTRHPNPNVVPPAPVLVQEGFSPGENTRHPNPTVKPPARAEVQEFLEKDSTHACPEKEEK